MNKSRISKVLALACALIMVVGSFAFFTDRAEIDGTAKAGNLAIGLEESTISADLKLGGDTDISNSAVVDNWNPGDSVNFNYEVTNEGNKAIRVQDTLTLTVKGKGGTYGLFDVNDGPMFTIACSDANGTAMTYAPDPESKLDAATNTWTLVYHINEYALSADGENAEKLTTAANVVAAAGNGMNAVNATNSSTTRTYKLVFNPDATNEYQDAEITIVAHVDAIQYANTDEVTANNIWNYDEVNKIEQETVYTTANGQAA